MTGACLARAGWSVLVLEAGDRPGGPAYAALGPELTELGLEYVRPRYFSGVSLQDGGSTVFSSSTEENVAEAEGLAPGDGDALAGLLKDFEPHVGPIFGLLGADLGTRRAAKGIQDLMHDEGGGCSEFAHLFTLAARDLLRQEFRSPVLHSTLAPWALHLGRGPDEANSALRVVLVQVALTMAGMPTPVGGSEQLARALTALIEKHGGAVRCGRRVDRILLKNGRAQGVRLADGQIVQAHRAVVASTNPDQLYLELLAHEPAAVSPVIRRQAGRYRYGRGCFQLHLALSEAPRFADERLASTGQPHLTGGLDALSLSVNEATRGLLPTEPTISFDCPSTVDKTRCPAGKAVARLQILDVPTELSGDAADEIDTGDGWTEDVKEAFADRVLEIAGRHVPNLPGAVLSRHLIAPPDLAGVNRNCGPGDPFGGSHDLAQSYVFRPLPGQPSHHTPVSGLSMVGAATWPGHGVNGGSGYIVAKMLLGQDRDD